MFDCVLYYSVGDYFSSSFLSPNINPVTTTYKIGEFVTALSYVFVRPFYFVSLL